MVRGNVYFIHISSVSLYGCVCSSVYLSAFVLFFLSFYLSLSIPLCDAECDGDDDAFDNIETIDIWKLLLPQEKLVQHFPFCVLLAALPGYHCILT